MARSLTLVLIFLGAACGAALAADEASVTSFKLSNGLEVVVLPDHRAPVVTHMIWYKVGSADETSGQIGACTLSRTLDV